VLPRRQKAAGPKPSSSFAKAKDKDNKKQSASNKARRFIVSKMFLLVRLVLEQKRLD